MLIIDVSINERIIDTIMIQNTGRKPNGLTSYEIREPKGEWETIHHKRDNGYLPLLANAIEQIRGKHGGNTCNDMRQGRVEGPSREEYEALTWQAFIDMDFGAGPGMEQAQAGP